MLDLGQLETEALQPGLDRLKLGSHRERLTSGQEADEVARLAFEPEDFRLQLAGAVVVRTRGGAEFGVDRLRGGQVYTLGGDWNPKRIVVTELPNIEQARRWYDSEEYRALKELRLRTARGSVVLVEGVP